MLSVQSGPTRAQPSDSPESKQHLDPSSNWVNRRISRWSREQGWNRRGVRPLLDIVVPKGSTRCRSTGENMAEGIMQTRGHRSGRSHQFGPRTLTILTLAVAMFATMALAPAGATEGGSSDLESVRGTVMETFNYKIGLLTDQQNGSEARMRRRSTQPASPS